MQGGRGRAGRNILRGGVRQRQRSCLRPQRFYRLYESFSRVAGVAHEDKIFRPRKFPDYMGLSIHGSLSAAVSAACCREAEGVAFHTTEILPVAGVLLRTSVPRGLAATQRLRCRRRQLPQALHAVTASTAASSLTREPWGRVAGIVCEDKKLSAEKISRLHESFHTRLPRGRCQPEGAVLRRCDQSSSPPRPIILPIS